MSMDVVRRRGDAANTNNERPSDHKAETVTSSLMETTAAGDDDDNYNDDNEAKKSNTPQRTRSTKNWLFLFGVVALIATAILCSFLSKIWCLRIITLLPVTTCLLRAATCHLWEQRLLPLAVVATTVFAQLPQVLGSAVAAICIVVFSLATVPPSAAAANSQNTSNNTPLRTVRPKGSALPVLTATLVLVTVLLTENFMVWVVSATFEAGQRSDTAPPPLQDNGRMVIRALTSGLTKYEVVGLRRLWNVQGALLACLGTSFVLAEIFERRPLYSLGLRGVLTMTAARTLRTISFLATVLPSQNKYCYSQHYPYPPPTEWKEWIWVGIIPASNGGCNDLIISGHATVTSTLACISASISNDPIFCVALWTMVVLDYMVEIYEGFHYSVDMWLGLVLVCLLWRVLGFVEPSLPTLRSPSAVDKSKKDLELDDASNKESTTAKFSGFASNKFLSRKATVTIYFSPTLVAFLQLVLLPDWTCNILVVVYAATTAILYLGFALPNKDPAKAAFIQHVAQHVLYSLLFMTLGMYL